MLVIAILLVFPALTDGGHSGGRRIARDVRSGMNGEGDSGIDSGEAAGIPGSSVISDIKGSIPRNDSADNCRCRLDATDSFRYFIQS